MGLRIKLCTYQRPGTTKLLKLLQPSVHCTLVQPMRPKATVDRTSVLPSLAGAEGGGGGVGGRDV
jgi:hypothetical protein